MPLLISQYIAIFLGLLTISPASSATLFNTRLLGVNNGPAPYRPDLGSNNLLTGGVNPTIQGPPANATTMSQIYRSMNIPGIRPNDEGGAFDLSCLFPISSLLSISNSTDHDGIPDPSGVANDSRWNWTHTDSVFSALLQGGFPPLVKLASQEWKGGQWVGLSYVSTDSSSPQYVIKTASQVGYCAPWPAIAPIITKIGDALVTTIVKRYNDAERWAADLAVAGIERGPPLEPSTWSSSISSSFVGVELQNEYNMLTCTTTGSNDTRTLQGWIDNCGGPPYTWNAKYWDGTPAEAHASYVSQALAIKKLFPNILIGGPALGTGPSFGIQSTKDSGLNSTAAGGVAYDWLNDFLMAVRDANAPMDFFSWHSYNTCTSPDGVTIDCTETNYNSNMAIASRMRSALDQAGFSGVPMVISEWNAAFGGNPGNAAPGTMAGAAMMAINIAQMSLMNDKFNIIAGYIVNGVDGPYNPHIQRSFPIGCIPEYVVPPVPGDGPEDLEFTGGWMYNCTYGPSGLASINSPSGMGIAYPNGDMKPIGVLYQDILGRLAGMEVFDFLGGDGGGGGDVSWARSVIVMGARPPTNTTTTNNNNNNNNKKVMILLANGDFTSDSPPLPSLSQMLNNSKAVVTRTTVLYSHIRALPSVIVPNNVAKAGTIQLEGGVLDDDGDGDGYGKNETIILPPAAVVLLEVDDDRGGGASGGGGGGGGGRVLVMVMVCCMCLYCF